MTTSATGTMTTVLVVQPDKKDDLQRLGQWLESEDVAVRLIQPFRGEAIPTELHEDGLIVLGGSMNASDDEAFPWLAEIRTLLRLAVERQLPTLGICLGAQLLARAMGGDVRPGEAGLECGVVEVTWMSAAEGDELVGELPEPFSAGSMHFDAIRRLPGGAVLLGVGSTYPHQVFRIGRAWGVQFHPEVTPGCFRSWGSAVAAVERAGYEQMADSFEQRDSIVHANNEALARSFARVLRRG
ncbi:type 1 glutamine amidotransferase [Herbiconiux sp. YIM B11900]|uniref:type 1 glutamine amidotransferase n=1 Tax=Herbiconiux sp. YIM B11900 TaxID=3404131 RepID=UPI003F83BCCD